MAVAFSSAWAPRVRALLRIVTGLLFLLHGTQKLCAFPDPSQAMPHLPMLMLVAAIIEVVCGALITVGLLTRYAAFLASGEMAVAYFKAHAPQSFWPSMNHGEAAVLFCFIFLYFAFAGAGAWSIDGAIGKNRAP